MRTLLRSMALCAICVAAPVLAAVHGTVTDAGGRPLADARVVLRSTGAWTVTDSAGRFDFASSSARDIGRFRVSGRGASLEALRGLPATVDLFALNGRRVARRNAPMSREVVRWASAGVHRLGTAHYAVRARIGEQRIDGLTGTLTGQDITCRTYTTGGGTPGLARKRAETADSIVVYRKGYEIATFAVGNEDAGTCALDPIERFIVAGTVAADYSAGNVSILSVPAFTVDRGTAGSSLHSDMVVFGYDGDAFLLERLGKDNIVRIDGATGQVLYQKSLGTGVNLQEIMVVDDDKAFVSQWQDSDLLIVDPATGTRTGVVSLADYVTYANTDSAETWPFATALARWEDVVYVACQRLKTTESQWGTSYIPADTSLIVMVDALADTVRRTIALHKKNPASMDVLNGKLYVSSTGSWSDNTDGGVEVIDLATGINEGVVADEESLGGNITTIVAVGAHKAFVAVGKSSADFSKFWTEIVTIDPASAMVGNAIEGIENAFGGIAYDGHYLYIGDRGTSSGGVVVVDPSDESIIEGPIDVGMPPSALTIVETGQ